MINSELQDLQIAEDRIENPSDTVSLEEMIKEYEGGYD